MEDHALLVVRKQHYFSRNRNVSPNSTSVSTFTVYHSQIFFAESDVEECKCDNRGTEDDSEWGIGCWLQKSPCKLLTGVVAKADWNWVNCKTSYGAKQINCQGNKIFDDSHDTLNFRLLNHIRSD